MAENKLFFPEDAFEEIEDTSDVNGAMSWQQLDNMAVGLNESFSGIRQVIAEGSEWAGFSEVGSAQALTQKIQADQAILEESAANAQSMTGAGVVEFVPEIGALLAMPTSASRFLFAGVKRGAASGAALSGTRLNERADDSRLGATLAGAAFGAGLGKLFQGPAKAKANEMVEQLRLSPPNRTGVLGNTTRPGPNPGFPPQPQKLLPAPAQKLLPPPTPKQLAFDGQRAGAHKLFNMTDGLPAAMKSSLNAVGEQLNRYKAHAMSMFRTANKSGGKGSITGKVPSEVNAKTTIPKLTLADKKLAKEGIKAANANTRAVKSAASATKLATAAVKLSNKKPTEVNINKATRLVDAAEKAELKATTAGDLSATIGLMRDQLGMAIEKLKSVLGNTKAAGVGIPKMTKPQLMKFLGLKNTDASTDQLRKLATRKRIEAIDEAKAARAAADTSIGGISTGEKIATGVGLGAVATGSAAGAGDGGGGSDILPLAIAAALLGGLGYRFLLRRGTRMEKAKSTEALARISAEADDIGRAADSAVASKTVPEASELFQATTGVKEFFSEFAGLIDTRIQMLAPGVSAVLRKMEFLVHHKTAKWQDQALPFFKTLNKAKLGDDDFITYKNLLMINRAKAESFLRKTGRGDLADSQVKHLNATLDEMAVYIGEADGLVDVKLLNNFFPRKVKDSRFFAFGEVKTYIAQLESSRGGKPLTAFEKDEVISSLMNHVLTSKGVTIEFGKAASSLQKRMKGRISKDQSYGYHDPHETFTSYVDSVVRQVERQRFYGGVGAAKAVIGPNGENLDTANSMMVKALKGGETTDDELREVAALLYSRFGKGEQAPSRWVQNFKNYSYALLIGNPLAAMTQVGDLALSAHINKIGNTATSLINELSRRGSIRTGLDVRTLLGVKNASQEFASTVKSKDVLDWALTYSGFKLMDTLGKNVFINAAMMKNQKRTLQEFRDVWRKTYDFDAPRGATPRTDAVYKKVQEFKHINNDNREDIGFLLMNELSSGQPITLSQVPKAYLDHPDGRMFYMLNSFTLKTLDIMRRDVLHPAQAGNYKQAAKNFAHLAFFFTTLNGTVEMAKDFVRGKDVEPIQNYIAENAMKLFGANKFMYDSANREGLGKAVASLLMAPTTLGDVLLDPKRLVKQTPVIGPILDRFQQ